MQISGIDSINQINIFPYVSFDVFDTLLFRAIPHYTGIFDLMEIEYYNKWGEKISNFREKRIKAEERARRLNSGKEICLDDIYSCLHYSQAIKDRLKNLEIECEIKNCIPNTIMISLLKKCKVEGKYIVIISDMYLPRLVFERIFKKLDIEYDFMFISSEEGVTKHSGLLYPLVLQRLCIDANQIIHIGDNEFSDIIQPMKYGIMSIERIQNIRKKSCYYIKRIGETSKGQHLNSFLNYGIQNYGDSPEVIIGYTILGPFLWDFCRWIHKTREEQKLDQLLFVAREGYLIMNVYKKMYPEEINSINYISLNKNLLRLPLLNCGDRIEMFLQSIPGKSVYKWKTILNYLYIETSSNIIDKIKDKYPLFDVNDNISVHELRNEGTNKDILLMAINMQMNEVQAQQKYLLEYLNTFHILNANIGIINNSINGSGQIFLETFLKENDLNSNILGLQFIMSNICEKQLCGRCKAWINECRKASYTTYLFFANAIVFEHLLFEPQGTALRFVKNDNEPVNVIYEQSRTERRNDHKILNIQQYAIQFIEDYSDNMCFDLEGMGYDLYMNLLKKPLKKEALYIGTLWDDDFDGDHQLIECTYQKGHLLSQIRKLYHQKGWFEGLVAITDMPKVVYEIVYILRVFKYYKRHNLFKGDSDYI